MILATIDGQRVRAEKGLTGLCLPSPPGCGGRLYARTEYEDRAVVPHWAHYPDPDGQHPCERRGSEMSEWHSWWQAQRNDDDSIEVIESDGDDRRIADIVTPGGVVVEAQHSAISDKVVAAREQLWSKHRTGIAWLIDATEVDGAGVANLSGSRRQATNWVNYRLPQNSSYARLVRRVRAPKVTAWVDFGESGVVEVHSHGDANGSGPIGRGWLVTRNWFIENVINGEFVTHHDRPSPARADRSARARRTDADAKRVDQICRRLLAVAERGTGRAEREVANLAPEDLEQVAAALPWNTDVATLAAHEIERRRRQEALAAEQERRRAELEQRLAEQERQRAEAEAQARARAAEERERWERERPEREARAAAERERWQREYQEREAARAERERLAMEEWERARQERARQQEETWLRIQARRAPQPCVYGCTPALLFPCGWRCDKHAPRVVAKARRAC